MNKNSERIQARWAEDAKGGTIEGLIPGTQPLLLTYVHTSPLSGSGSLRSKRSQEALSFTPQVQAPAGTGSFEIWVDGGLMVVKHPKIHVHSDKQTPHWRGTVNGFSAKARRRLMYMMAKLRSDTLPLFVTLTYPSEFERDYRQWKNDLDKFARRFHRKFPDGAFIWRLEPQRRGAPHYHLLVYGVSMSGDNVRWFHEAWYGSVASEDAKHYQWGVHVDAVRSSRGVRAYVGKYIAKRQAIPDPAEAETEESGSTPVDWVHVGRWWGIRYAHNLPEAERFSATGLDKDNSSKLMRAMRGYLRSKGVRVSGNLPSLTMFVDSPQNWVASIEGLIGGIYKGSGSFGAIGKRLLQ